ncbi:MAG TPA: AI-2E family transporter [Verrucomicrobiales bacterium]|nr:AI-2E family transporter [Verrucomicrobiales bacterium]
MILEPPDEGSPAGSNTTHPLSLRIAAKLVVFTLVCGFLYVAKPILLPIALAAFLTFVFAPVVRGIQTLRAPRILAVLIALGGVAAGVGAVSWFGFKQLSALAEELPAYRVNILEKLSDIRSLGRDGPIKRVSEAVESISEEAEEMAASEEEQEGEGAPRKEEVEKPVEVVLMPRGDPLGLSRMTALRPVAGYAGTAGLVLLLTFFFLYYREDLRNRLLSFAGEARLLVTTRALNDAGSRISRYLLAQAVVNGTYGVAAGLGFWAMGVPYALLWGVGAFLLRYIPYVGPWAAAVPPVVCALVMYDGWTKPLSVIGLILVLELLSNNLMEPWLYGRSAGLSEVAIIISAVVWAFLWGPIGLVLATPLSVCIVVLGRFVPGLSFIARLMGSDPGMDPAAQLYHRLASLDTLEAKDIVRRNVEERGLRETIDELALPALALAARDLQSGIIPAEEADEVAEAAESVMEKAGLHASPRGAAMGGEEADSQLPLVIGLPAGGRFESSALEFFAAGRDDCRWRLVESGILVTEFVEIVRRAAPAGVCVVALSERSLLRARRWCKRLHSEIDSLRIVIGYWGAEVGRDLPRDMIQAPEGCELATTASETWRILQPWLALEPATPEEAA